MSHIREMLHDIPIPSFLKVKQDINRETVPDCTAKVLSELNVQRLHSSSALNAIAITSEVAE